MRSCYPASPRRRSTVSANHSATRWSSCSPSLWLETSFALLRFPWRGNPRQCPSRHRGPSNSCRAGSPSPRPCRRRSGRPCPRDRLSEFHRPCKNARLRGFSCRRTGSTYSGSRRQAPGVRSLAVHVSRECRTAHQRGRGLRWSAPRRRLFRTPPRTSSTFASYLSRSCC